MTRRLLAMLLSVALLLSMVPAFGITAQAAETYNASKAISYAKSHWNDGKGLCAEFVSDCLAAGGITIPNKSCYSSTTASYQNNRGQLGKYTNPYLSSAAVLLYLSERYKVITDPEMSEIAVGDIAFLIGGSSGNKRDGHVGIIIKIEDGEPIYAAHNNNTNSGRFYPNSNPCTYVVKMSQPKDGSSGSDDTGSSGNTGGTECGCDTSYAGTYICTTESTELRIRSGHGTSYAKVGAIPKGATVTVTMANGDWAHVEYNGVTGYASMDYLTLKTPASYTVAYDANGGSGAPGNQTKTHGTALTLSTTVPTRTGYTFQGWATSASGAVAYQKGGSYTENANVTLYAVWKINSYTVTYNANGGSGAPGSQTKTHGTALTLSTTVPTRTGYTFQGWATSASGAVAYQKGGSYTADANVTLYAVWKANIYAVSYSSNGGTGAPFGQTKTHDTALTLSTTVPTRPGYTFQGWATSANGEVRYQPGDRYTANGNVTLYAVWKVNTYTVGYNANGGSGAPAAQTEAQGTALTLSSIQPTRVGYTFMGWATSAGGTVVYQPGSVFSEGKDVTLYAVWERNKKSYGDADGDGYVDAYDAALIMKYSVGAEESTALNLRVCDLDGDGFVDAFDAALAQKYSVGAIELFPVEQG